MIAIDTNLLVYAHRSSTSEHRAARAALERAMADERGWGVALPVIMEFWSVVTHPALMKEASPSRRAAAFLVALWREGGAAVWAPSVGFHERVIEHVREHDVGGPRIYDLQIALIASENGAEEIWTHDRGFRSIPGLPVIDPL